MRQPSRIAVCLTLQTPNNVLRRAVLAYARTGTTALSVPEQEAAGHLARSRRRSPVNGASAGNNLLFPN